MFKLRFFLDKVELQVSKTSGLAFKQVQAYSAKLGLSRQEIPMLSLEARSHLEKYWQLSVRFFREPDFALAAFFAITLIEEIGKVVILGNTRLGTELDKKGFYDHRRKYAYAVYATLFVNSRVSRIYGAEERKFGKWFTEGELVRIRNRALYIELQGTETVVPKTAVSKEDAFLLVCIAGEVYAEVQGSMFTGSGPDEWKRILREVDSFRASSSP